MGQHSNIFGTERFRKRFDAKVMLVPFSDCHYWMGTVGRFGYGEIKVDGRIERAHRVAFRLSQGFIPDRRKDGQLVRHTCDQPLCVNPDHLIAGTQADNMTDKKIRGRAPKGERHVHAKLADADVEEIKVLAVDGWQTGVIAEAYGVTCSLISTIRHGNVDGSTRAAGGEKPTGRTDRRMSDQNAKAIYLRINRGERGCDLAAEYGVKPSFISDIKRGATYASVTGFGGN